MIFQTQIQYRIKNNSLLNGERDEQGEIDLPRDVEAYLPLCAPDPVLNRVRDQAVSWE